jgi:hypothetical protein
MFLHDFLSYLTAMALTPTQRRNQRTILIIALICLAPFAAAWYFARHPQLVMGDLGNVGHLVNPPVPLGYGELLAAPVTSLESMEQLKGRWIVLSVADGPCAEPCRQNLYKTRQMRLMLNKEIPRVRRLLLLADPDAAAALADWLRQDEFLAVAGLAPALREKLEKAAGGPLQPGQILLLDPLGNLMMYYEADFDPYGVLKDLKHLLRASQIG